MSDEALAKLAQVFQVVFSLPQESDARQARQDSITAWDSLGHVMLVSAISSEFGVEISAIDSLDVTSFDAAATLLSDLLGGAAR